MARSSPAPARLPRSPRTSTSLYPKGAFASQGGDREARREAGDDVLSARTSVRSTDCRRAALKQPAARIAASEAEHLERLHRAPGRHPIGLSFPSRSRSTRRRTRSTRSRASERRCRGSTTAQARRPGRSGSASTRCVAGTARGGSRPSETRATAASCPRRRSSGCAADRAEHQLSARNRFSGIVRDVRVDGLMAQVEMVVTEPAGLTAIVTADAVEELGLKPGRPRRRASIKATSVMVER